MTHPSPEIRDIVRLHASANGFCATSWEIAIEFRPLKRGFSVWLHTDEMIYETGLGRCRMSPDDMPFWRRGVSKKPLTWREMVEWVGGCYQLEGLGGSGLLDSAWVDSELPPWADELVLIAWVRWENDYAHILADMLERPDEEIAALWAVLGGFSGPDASERHARMDELLEEAIEDLQPTGLEPDEVIHQALSTRHTIHQILEAHDAPIESLAWWSKELFFREQPGPAELGLLEDALRLRLGLPERVCVDSSSEASGHDSIAL